MNGYIQNESTQHTLMRAFSNIATALNQWSHTDLKKVVRVNELNRAQEIIFILMTAARGSDDDPFHLALTKILSKTSNDITLALTGTKIDFSEHVKSFKWMAENLK